MNEVNINRLATSKGLFKAALKDGAFKGYKLNLGRDYYVFVADGDCLNSERCSLRMADGHYYIAHRIELTEAAVWDNIGKVVAFLLDDGRGYAKELHKWDGVSETLILRCFIPEEQYIFVSLAAVEALFVADWVL